MSVCLVEDQYPFQPPKALKYQMKYRNSGLTELDPVAGKADKGLTLSASAYNLGHSGKSLFPNIFGLPLLLFFWLKWAGYLAVAGLNLLVQISDRISPFSV